MARRSKCRESAKLEAVDPDSAADQLKLAISGLQAFEIFDGRGEILGLAPGLPPERQFGRILAESGCELVIPTLIRRELIQTDDAQLRQSQQTWREWIYRQAFHMGRHPIGFEVQKVLAAVDRFRARRGERAKIGVVGYAEGGLIAFYAAAIDTRRRLVLLRRDDVEHLVMIGGPTDIVIESRIVTAPAESARPAEKPVQKTERVEAAPVLQETPVRTAETPAVARTAHRASRRVPSGVSYCGPAHSPRCDARG